MESRRERRGALRRTQWNDHDRDRSRDSADGQASMDVERSIISRANPAARELQLLMNLQKMGGSKGRVILSEAKDPLPRGVMASLQGILRFAQDDTEVHFSPP